MSTATARLDRTTLRTSRLLDFCSRKELIAQTGHQTAEWPLVILKELVDNATDACEEADTPPEITVQVENTGITITDNGPGIPADTIKDVLDFTVRVSSREAYVAPDRGAQGNALKTLVAMPFVLVGERGRVDITAAGAGDRPQDPGVQREERHRGAGPLARFSLLNPT
jgi:DNA topoisomerase VI subunit B